MAPERPTSPVFLCGLCACHAVAGSCGSSEGWASAFDRDIRRLGRVVAPVSRMIEQPSSPDFPRPPDIIDRPPPDIRPVPPPDIPPPAGPPDIPPPSPERGTGTLAV